MLFLLLLVPCFIPNYVNSQLCTVCRLCVPVCGFCDCGLVVSNCSAFGCYVLNGKGKKSDIGKKTWNREKIHTAVYLNKYFFSALRNISIDFFFFVGLFQSFSSIKNRFFLLSIQSLKSNIYYYTTCVIQLNHTHQIEINGIKEKSAIWFDQSKSNESILILTACSNYTHCKCEWRIFG